jgi:Mg2+/Co2+ transporter CorB
MILAVAIALACVGLAAFCAAAQHGIVAASRSAMRSMEEAGNTRAILVNRLMNDRERFVGTMIVGHTLGMIGGVAAVVSAFASYGVVELTLFCFIATILFAQFLPRMMAVGAPERVALTLAYPASWLTAIVGPFASLLIGLVRLVLRPLGLQDGSTSAVLSASEELRDRLDILHRQGDVAKAQHAMLGGLLDLEDLSVSEVMVHRTKMRTINADLPSQDIVREVLASPYTRMPLWRDSQENIVGVLHAKDLLRALDAVSGDASKLKVEEIALDSWYVPATTSLRDQLKAFLARKTHFALAVDEYGEVMGLITLEDILEEIVGDIRDEHDVSVKGVRPQPNGSVNVDGSVPIRDLNRAMDWDLPDDEATTVAGLVIHEARAIPEAGQVFTFHGFRFQVLRKSRNRIMALRVIPLAMATEPVMPERASKAE